MAAIWDVTSSSKVVLLIPWCWGLFEKFFVFCKGNLWCIHFVLLVASIFEQMNINCSYKSGKVSSLHSFSSGLSCRIPLNKNRDYISRYILYYSSFYKALLPLMCIKIFILFVHNSHNTPFLYLPQIIK